MLTLLLAVDHDPEPGETGLSNHSNRLDHGRRCCRSGTSDPGKRVASFLQVLDMRGWGDMKRWSHPQGPRDTCVANFTAGTDTLLQNLGTNLTLKINFRAKSFPHFQNELSPRAGIFKKDDFSAFLGIS